jgi:hypothetical protein
MSETQKIRFLTFLGLAGYAVWAAIAFCVDRTQVDGFLTLTKGVVIGIIGLVLRDMKSPGEGAATPGKVEQGDGSA